MLLLNKTVSDSVKIRLQAVGCPQQVDVDHVVVFVSTSLGVGTSLLP